jgi:uncharacterized protein YegL
MNFENFEGGELYESNLEEKTEKILIDKYGNNWRENIKEEEKKARDISKMVGMDLSMDVAFGEPGKGSFYNFENNSIRIDPTQENIQFVATHEGSHRAISKLVKDLKVPKKEEHLKEKMLNDQAKVGWHFTFNALEDMAVNNWVSGIFPRIKELEKEAYSKINDTIEKKAVENGSMPRFMRYGFEAINQRYHNSFSSSIPKEIKESLERTSFLREQLYKQIPFGQKEKEVLPAMWERYKLCDLIWNNEVSKLAKEDLEDEKLKELIKKEFSNSSEGEDNLSGDEKKELKEHLDKKKEELEKYLEKKLKNGEISEEDFKESINKNNPINLDELSDEIKEKLKKKLEELSREKKKEIEEKAKKNMEETEDEINEELAPKMSQIEKHSERKERELHNAKEAEEREKMEQFREKIIKESLENEWERKRIGVLKEINDLYNSIEKLFVKNKLSWDKGFNLGQKINLRSAMQAEAYPKIDIWEQKKCPKKEDYRFTILNDQSGSMDGEKIKNDFLAKIIFSETLSKLKIPFEVLGYSDNFNNTIRVYKDFKDKDLKNKRTELSKILSEVGGGTPSKEATIIASDRLSKQQKDNSTNAHFLFVITDGYPNGTIEDLNKTNKKIEKETGQIILGMGIGKDINEEALKEIYGENRSIYCANPKEFPNKMATLLHHVFHKTQKQS